MKLCTAWYKCTCNNQRKHNLNLSYHSAVTQVLANIGGFKNLSLKIKFTKFITCVFCFFSTINCYNHKKLSTVMCQINTVNWFTSKQIHIDLKDFLNLMHLIIKIGYIYSNKTWSVQWFLLSQSVPGQIQPISTCNLQLNTTTFLTVVSSTCNLQHVINYWGNLLCSIFPLWIPALHVHLSILV